MMEKDMFQRKHMNLRLEKCYQSKAILRHRQYHVGLSRRNSKHAVLGLEYDNSDEYRAVVVLQTALFDLLPVCYTPNPV